MKTVSKKISLKRKITQAFLIVCIAALLVSAGVTVGILFNMRDIMVRAGADVREAAADVSAGWITSHVLYDTADLVAAKAETINWDVREAIDLLRLITSYAEALYNEPEAYYPVYIPNYKDVAENTLALHWFLDPTVMPVPEYNENDLTELGLLEETYLLGNIAPMFEEMMRLRDDIQSIYIQTRTGVNAQYDVQAFLKAQIPEIPVMKQRPWFSNAFESGGTYISDTYPDSAGRGLCITMSMPAYDKYGEFVAVLGFDLLIDDLSETVNNMFTGAGEYAMLLGRDRVIAARGLTEGGEFELPPFWDEVSASESGVTESAIYGYDVYAVWDTIPLTGWKLVKVMSVADVNAPADYARAEIADMTRELLRDADSRITLLIIILSVILIVIMIAVVALSRAAAVRISKPILALSDGAKRIGNGDLDYTFSIKTRDEIEELANAFNSMVAGVKTVTIEHERSEMERMEKERETRILLDAHKQLQTVLDMLPVGVGIISMEDFTILYVNQALTTALGFDPSDKKPLTGSSVFGMMPEIQADGSRTADVIISNLKKNVSVMELQCRRQDGELFSARVSFANINYEGVPVSLGVIEDITAEEEHREMLRNIALREQEANQLKSRFLANMSHEIRTPMNAILGTAEIQLQKNNLTADTEEALIQIYESGDLLLNIINDILDLSKIESGKLEIVPLAYDIPSLINDAAQVNRLRYESKPVEFTLDIDEDTPVNLFGDELRIKQILNNILSNAFKYTDKGEVRMTVSAENKRDTSILIFRVSDTGQGMTPDQVTRLFDEYTRFNTETNRTTVGAGLGMSITKRLIDLMDGEIHVVSEPNIGTTFTVRLPQRRLDTLTCGRKLAANLRNFDFHSTKMTQKGRMLREHMPYGSVLVVDDVASNIYVTKGMLLPYELKVDTVTGGIDAIELIKSGNVYDIIFMDHMMPKMDGIQATKIIRDMGYTNTIVALTANALVGHAEMFLQNGFDSYLSKPIDSRELNRILNEFIRDKRNPTDTAQ